MVGQPRLTSGTAEPDYPRHHGLQAKNHPTVRSELTNIDLDPANAAVDPRQANAVIGPSAAPRRPVPPNASTDPVMDGYVKMPGRSADLDQGALVA